MDVRSIIVAWARWGATNHAGFSYSQGADRMEGVHRPGELPAVADCSAAVTYWYSWAGAPDPNGLGYDGYGFTGTLLEHGLKIPLGQVIPGDVIVYGMAPGEHTALVVEAGSDPLTVSHGQQGDPSQVRVSQDGRQPQTYLRFNTTAVGRIAYPPGFQPPPPRPGSPAEIVYKASPNARPAGHPVTLTPKGPNDRAWAIYECQLLNAAGIKPLQPPSKARYGWLQRNRTIRYKRAHGLRPDGLCGIGTYDSFGVR